MHAALVQEQCELLAIDAAIVINGANETGPAGL